MAQAAQAQAPSRGMGDAASTAAPAYRWWVLVTVVFGAFVSILDNTIVNTAIPKLQAVFGADIHQISYVATGYTLASGVVVPATGFLANRFGVKQVYLSSLTLFTIGSALCGLAWNTPSIIFFRVIQGAGGAALFPLSFAILFSVFPPQERGRANGFFGIPVLFAPAIGPTIGGFIVQYADWRWIFYVNVPIGIAGVILGRAILRETLPRPNLRFDLRGFLIISPALALLLYGLSNLAYDGWNSTLTVSGPTIIAIVLLLIWIPVQLRTKQPLLDLRLFAQRNFLMGNLVTWIGTAGIFGPAFLLPQFLQNLRGLDPFPAGVLLFTSGVGTVIGTVTAGNLYNRLGARTLIIIGALLTIGSSLLLQHWSTLYSAYAVLPWILMVRGIGLPFMLQSANTSALFGISNRNLPDATTLNVVCRNVVGALSIAALTNILKTGQLVHQANLASRVTLSDPGVNSVYSTLVNHFTALGHSVGQATGLAIGQLYGMVVKQSFALSYQDVYFLTAVVTIPVIALALLLQSPSSASRARAMSGPVE